ncbi:extracellular solute-binding protein [Paenibacillus spongiae]|uniref:Extracellular solute-binding protein n=1 Tax=Paenibacillus spongiae TaxID=2909671 RepID=A0ABY5SG75_9BACL|nr:extracellular solute-binding protein [Paenibacillus spongiae]UVI31705.1 extracellular solute-binding protein [Paenibacillus spongiae]
MKRLKLGFMSVLLLAVVVVSACSNAAPEKEENGGEKAAETLVNGKMVEPVTMTIAKSVNPNDNSLPEGDTVDNNAFTRLLKEKTNVEFKATLTGAAGDAYNQKLQVAIASDDIPDVMLVTESQLKQLVDSDMLEDLTDVYNKYANDWFREVYKSGNDQALKNATFDGKLMAIPGAVFESDSIQLLWIRKDWLDKLGLEVPKTLEDIEKVAKAFIEKDPDGNGKPDTVGLTGIPGLVGVTHGFDSIFSAFHAYPDFWIKDASGKVVHGSTAPETKQALELLRKWYEGGIIEKEFALRKDPNELVVGGKAGMHFGEWWTPWGFGTQAVKVDPKADWQAYPVPLDKEGTFNGKMVQISPTYAVVKKGYKYPEALMAVLNASATDAEFQNISNSINPGHMPVRLVTDWADAVTRRTANFQQYLGGNTDTSSFDIEATRLLDAIKSYSEKGTADLDSYGPAHSYLVGGGALLQPMNKVRNLYYSQTKTMEAKWTSITKVQNETFLKIIMGSAPLEAFDEYVTQFDKLGGNVIAKEVEEAISK